MANQRASGEQIKEVYAQFGAAYYMAECMYRGACNLLVVIQIGDGIGMTRPRVEELLTSAYAKTLGQIILELEPLISHELFAELRQATELRNFLAHYFWFERCHLLSTEDDVLMLLSELQFNEHLFKSMDAKLSSVQAPMTRSFGIDQSQINQITSLLEDGIEIEPICKQRKLKKQERVVHIWEDVSNPQIRPLYLETDDGVLWQLCDSGLGWSCREKVDPTWQEPSELSNYLPVTIDPRPKPTKKWEYEFRLSSEAVFWVKLGTVKDTFRWGVRSNINAP